MTQSISFILLSVIIYQAFFFSITLWASKEKEPHYGILSALTGIVGLNFLNILLMYLGWIEQHINFGVMFGFLYGPLILHFIQTMIFRESDELLLHKLHYFPAIIVAIPILLFLAGYSFIDYYTFTQIVIGPVIIHFGWYIYKSSKKLNEYQQILKESRSDLKAHNLSWLKHLLSIFLVIIAVLTAEAIVSDQSEEIAGVVVFAGVLYMLGYLYYKAINQSIFLVIKKPKYEQNTLGEQKKKRIYTELEYLMKENKPWLDPELTLGQLAVSMNESSRNISMIINEIASSNFYEYVNKYRINEAKYLLERSDQHEKRINEIMYDSGFHTKSSFNTEFKKYTGLSPSSYRKKYRSNT